LFFLPNEIFVRKPERYKNVSWITTYLLLPWIVLLLWVARESRLHYWVDRLDQIVIQNENRFIRRGDVEKLM
jgi:hypothetical protein